MILSAMLIITTIFEKDIKRVIRFTFSSKKKKTNICHSSIAMLKIENPSFDAFTIVVGDMFCWIWMRFA